jgi:glycosyltransferase involved in cell wall biosynthesis
MQGSPAIHKALSYFVGGGAIGSNPYDLKTWSGSSVFLLTALEADGILAQAFGVKLPVLQDTWLRIKNFHPKRTAWSRNYRMDPAYREAMTRAAGRLRPESPFCLQLGHWYSLPSVFPNKICLSYHDGNLAGSIGSGFALQGVSATRIDQAMRYEEETAQQMTAVLTMSEYLRQSFIHDYHVPAERVFNIGAGVNLKTLPEVRAKDYTAPRILFIGTDFERKGGPDLLRAFAMVRQSMPAAELHIVGPLQLGRVPDGVLFHGRLSKNDPAQNAKLESLFRESNLFVLPSLYEPFGIAPLEAMLYRIPCVLTDAWAFQEFIRPGFNGNLAQKGSAEDWAAKILALLSDPDKLAEMGDHAREHVLARYTWQVTSKNIAAVLDSLDK